MTARRLRPFLLLCLMAGIVWVVADSAAENYHWQWYRGWPYLGTWSDGVFTPGPLLHGLALTLKIVAGGLAVALLSGGLLLGAFFMATDYTTSPYTTKGQIVYGLLLGVITCGIRFWGNMAEGVSYAILIMNLLVPYINALTRHRPLGVGGGKK